MPEISAAWHQMSKEEKIAATETSMEGLKERKEMKALSRHNVPLNAYNDAAATLATLGQEVSLSFDIPCLLC